MRPAEPRGGRLALNYLYNISYQALVIILPFVTAPYLSRVLGAELLGSYSYTYSIASYFILFAMLGINNYGNRSIARVRDDRRARSETFWGIWSLHALTSVAALVVYACFCATQEGVNGQLQLIWGLYVLSAGFDVNWFFFGMEQFRLTVTRNFLIKLTTFLLMFATVRTHDDLPIYTAITATGFLVSQLALWPFLLREVDLVRPSLRQMLGHLRPMLVLFVPVIAISLYTQLDTILVGMIGDMTQVAYYANAAKIQGMPLTLITALGTVMLPRASHLVAQGDEGRVRSYLGLSTWFVSLLSLGLAAGLAGLADSASVIYLGAEFAGVAPVLATMAAAVPFIAWADVLRNQYLMPHGLDRAYVTSVVLGATANVVLCLALIGPLGATGAALGYLSSEMCVCAYQTWVVRRMLPIGAYLREAAPFLACALVTLAGLRAARGLAMGSIAGLLVVAACGACAYLGLAALACLATRNEHARAVAEKLRGRLGGRGAGKPRGRLGGRGATPSDGKGGPDA